VNVKETGRWISAILRFVGGGTTSVLLGHHFHWTVGLAYYFLLLSIWNSGD
jgi:hypothetical protein